MRQTGRHLIEIDHLSVGYKSKRGGEPLIRQFDTAVLPGELVAIIGRNGTGKSTLIRTLCGLQEPLSGMVKVEGKSFKHFTAAGKARKISFVSTEIIRMNYIRVYELVALGRYPYTGITGTLGSRDREIVNNAINAVGLNDKADEFISQISDGERQRAMVARALAQDTGILMLDEPTAFLDILHRYELIHLLYSLTRESGKAVIFSTHDLQIAFHVADRIWLVEDRNLVQGAPEDVILSGKLSMIYNGKGYHFDEKTISMSLKRDAAGKIGVSGKPGRYIDMTVKMLDRMGWEAITGKEMLPMITIDLTGNDPVWILRKNSGIFHLGSLYELSLHFLPDT